MLPNHRLKQIILDFEGAGVANIDRETIRHMAAELLEWRKGRVPKGLPDLRILRDHTKIEP
jgi:hypothetical protein